MKGKTPGAGGDQQKAVMTHDGFQVIDDLLPVTDVFQDFCRNYYIEGIVPETVDEPFGIADFIHSVAGKDIHPEIRCGQEGLEIRAKGSVDIT
jgi:hypothetical protein